ncbi:3-deoxy-D-manno-octulosonic acid transferase [Actomonas aquatica]|uniref:3-deoxy-D-manno-octulosonic acid transferase n=1 Tax=Actomonas aquatica TaxID=2866162 RepID=A0ABZ1CCN2_9BACT|nr:glycosyltransferase N-terminal domain-containing protein [Opitutus sp. WL0086]WRQ89150.1 glycosyltransferase N-terminal domain-containing protein [Opitutus sp. WL0086]
MALWFYRLVFLPVMLVLAPYYLWRMRRRGGYGDGFGQRFGAVPSGLPAKSASGKRRVWLQAVSVGELLAIGPLLRRLAALPDVEVYLTTTTSTGYRLARERYAAETVAVAYFPMDFWPFVARAWRQVEADVLVLTEGERWPEHMHQAARRGVPVLSINARLSDRSYRRMRKVRALVPGLMGNVTQLLAVSAEDARRFIELGFAAERVRVTGNLKVDNAITEIDAAARLALRQELGFAAADTILLGSSTWPGEEAVLVEAWQKARAAGLGTEDGGVLRLLLVPRHAERRAEVEALVAATGQRYHLRSRGVAPSEVDIAVADTTGELQRLTQLADLVVVGKSLPPHTEGQTPVEAAGLGRPILFGPGMGSFRAIAQDLVQVGAAQRLADAAEVAPAVSKLLQDKAARKRMGGAGRAWHVANRGALDRTVEAIRLHLGL